MTVSTTDMTPVRILREETGAAIASEAAHLVREGGVLAMPTDSFYALGACAFDDAAVRRVCDMKGQREQKPILVLIADRSQLGRLVASVPPAATVLMKQFWPGPLTIVFPAASNIPAALTAGTGTIGVRVPAHPLLVQLLHVTGPLTGTSANRSGEPPAKTALDVERSLGSDVDLILDGGPASATVPSTVVDVRETVRVLREGPITRAALKALLDREGIAVA